ncbi:MAG TPA: hypothetical protein VFI26_05970 [Lysobacter sp.]|nr:hypothetical protein [Lysobacter sp.]
MGIVAKSKFALLALAFVISACSAAGQSNDQENWMIGFWHMTIDEDNGPLGGVIEFKPNGIYVGYDNACNSLGEIDYHVYRGNIYVTNTIPGKGPVSVIFHPSEDRTKLTFTSSRTRNNAVYERLSDDKCIPSN